VNRLAAAQVDTGLARGHPMLLSVAPTEDTTRGWPNVPLHPYVDWPDVPLHTYVDWGSKTGYRILGGTPSPWAVLGRPFVHLMDAAPAAQATYPGTDAMLILAAESGNEAAFVQVAAKIDWSQCAPIDFVRAVGLALTAGAHLLARNLASEGTRLHSDDQQLRKMARVLAPPQLLNADITPTGSVRPNQTWLRDNGGQYEGQWVALRQGTLLAAGRTAREVWDRLQSTEGVMLTKVF